MNHYSFWISLVVSSLLIIGCGEVKPKQAAAKPRVTLYPKKLPVPPKSTTITRTLLFNLSIASTLEQTLATEKNLYTPDNCVQWVRYTGQGLSEDNIELSNTYCPYQGVADVSNVVARIKTKQSSSPTLHHMVSDSGLLLGELRVQGTRSNTPQDIWKLEELCTAAYKNACIIEVTASKFAGVSAN